MVTRTLHRNAHFKRRHRHTVSHEPHVHGWGVTGLPQYASSVGQIHQVTVSTCTPTPDLWPASPALVPNGPMQESCLGRFDTRHDSFCFGHWESVACEGLSHVRRRRDNYFNSTHTRTQKPFGQKFVFWRSRKITYFDEGGIMSIPHRLVVHKSIFPM